MGKHSPFALPLTAIPEGRFERGFRCDSECCRDWECDDILEADIDVALTGNRHGDVYDLDLRLTGRMSTPCDRCLDPVEVPVDVEEHLTLRYGLEHDESKDGVVVLSDQETVYDLGPYLRDTLMLALPMRRVHAPGECNPGMEEYLSGDMDEEEAGDE